VITDRWGIDSGYEDCDHRWHATPPQTRRAILRAMQADDQSEPPPAGVKVVVRGRSTGLRGPGALRLEDGRQIAVEGALPRDLPAGYHDFQPARGAPLRLIVTPRACYLRRGMRLWGWAAQLYALRSARSWGIGDLADLRDLAEWSASLGGGVILVSPLCAAAPGPPQQPSPYFPSSRRFLNPIYLSMEDSPGMEALAASARALNQQRVIERDRVWQLKMQALARQWEQFAGHPAFEEYCREQGGALRQFAAFSVLAEQWGADWHCWPAAGRNPHSPAIDRFAAEHARRLRFHQWLQWRLDIQLARCGERLAIMQDLPVGVDPRGADAWAWQDVLAQGINVGAPPDPFAAGGQDWGLPPFIPHRLRAARYEPFIQTIRAALRHAGALRLDHVMGLFRLFWIPQGAPASEGTYVRYPVNDLLGILALESHRAKAVIVGEDLGTVEAGVRQKLAAHHVLSSRVLWFESDPPEKYPRHSLASVTTHDLPTVAGLWNGSDERAQREAGLPVSVESNQAMRQRLRDLSGVAETAPVREVIARTHERLGRAPSMMITATLDDALAVEERPNMPSTLDQWPNWSLALPRTLEELKTDPLPRAVAAALQGTP
jgi:4-alpha-glucanotransferase